MWGEAQSFSTGARGASPRILVAGKVAGTLDDLRFSGDGVELDMKSLHRGTQCQVQPRRLFSEFAHYIGPHTAHEIAK